MNLQGDYVSHAWKGDVGCLRGLYVVYAASDAPKGELGCLRGVDVVYTTTVAPHERKGDVEMMMGIGFGIRYQCRPIWMHNMKRIKMIPFF